MKNYKFAESSFTFEGDASRFDRNMLESVVECAFGMTRGCFRQGRKIDRAFRYMMTNFINKRFITPEGSLFKFSKGIPSGHV